MNVRLVIKAIISLSIIISLLFSSLNLVYAAVVLDSNTASMSTSEIIYAVHWGVVSAHGCSWNQHLYDKAKVTSIKVYMYKFGSPTGTLKCRVASHTGTYGTSSKPLADLETSTNSKDIASLSSSSARPTLVTFTFAGIAEILKDTPYTFYVYAESGSLDGSNYCVVRSTSGTAHDGNRFQTTGIEGTWGSSTSRDLWFRVYGEEIPTAEWHEISSWTFQLATRQWTSISNWLFELQSLLAFPIGPTLFRVAILVTLNDEPMDKINITISGGPYNMTFWKVTDLRGEAIVRLKGGTYRFLITHGSYLVEHNISIVKHSEIHFELSSPEYRIVTDWTSQIIQIVSASSLFIGVLALLAYHNQKTVSKQWRKIKALKGKPEKEIKKNLKGKR